LREFFIGWGELAKELWFGRDEIWIAVPLHKVGPEGDVLGWLRPGTIVVPKKLAFKIVRQIRSVVNHVGLMDGEYGVALLAGFFRQISVPD
jgi:hypothetical protein